MNQECSGQKRRLSDSDERMERRSGAGVDGGWARRTGALATPSRYHDTREDGGPPAAVLDSHLSTTKVLCLFIFSTKELRLRSDDEIDCESQKK